MTLWKKYPTLLHYTIAIGSICISRSYIEPFSQNVTGLLGHPVRERRIKKMSSMVLCLVFFFSMRHFLSLCYPLCTRVYVFWVVRTCYVEVMRTRYTKEVCVERRYQAEKNSEYNDLKKNCCHQNIISRYHYSLNRSIYYAEEGLSIYSVFLWNTLYILK